jgi:hypothetical protein
MTEPITMANMTTENISKVFANNLNVALFCQSDLSALRVCSVINQEDPK